MLPINAGCKRSGPGRADQPVSSTGYSSQGGRDLHDGPDLCLLRPGLTEASGHAWTRSRTSESRISCKFLMDLLLRLIAGLKIQQRCARGCAGQS